MKYDLTWIYRAVVRAIVAVRVRVDNYVLVQFATAELRQHRVEVSVPRFNR